jgi:hypothetical protein
VFVCVCESEDKFETKLCFAAAAVRIVLCVSLQSYSACCELLLWLFIHLWLVIPARECVGKISCCEFCED